MFMLFIRHSAGILWMHLQQRAGTQWNYTRKKGLKLLSHNCKDAKSFFNLPSLRGIFISQNISSNCDFLQKIKKYSSMQLCWCFSIDFYQKIFKQLPEAIKFARRSRRSSGYLCWKRKLLAIDLNFNFKFLSLISSSTTISFQAI